MIKRIPVNVSSLKLVEEELNLTVRAASAAFEAYLSDRNKLSHMEECSNTLVQIRGILKILELKGAVMLSEEMLTVIMRILDTQKASDIALSALSHAFVALPCYMEHTVARQYALPILLVDYINELRSTRRVELTPESQFADMQSAYTANIPITAAVTINEDFVALVRRLRHMYHLGLLGIIKEENLDYKMKLMQRAVNRLQSISAGKKMAELWWLSGVVISAMAEGDLALRLYRKRLLSSIDKYIKALVYGGSAALDTAIPEVLHKELLFLACLAGTDNESCKAVVKAYKLPDAELSDLDIMKEQASMKGPNAATIASMVKVLKEELYRAKEILEIASQDVGSTTAELQPLLKILQKVSDILMVVGLKSPAQILKEQIETITPWAEGKIDLNTQGLLEVADALLYVESTLTGLDRLDLSDEDILTASEMAKKEVIAKSHLQEAELVVIKEALAGISLAKRAITSFIESNYDTVHISNVAVTLKTVRGGLSVLCFGRAAAVLNSCINFVENTLTKGFSEDSITELLETLADALISLEYYLGEMEGHREPDEKVLELAEESLTALGYPVDVLSPKAASVAI